LKSIQIKLAHLSAAAALAVQRDPFYGAGMASQPEVVIVGGGIVGLATALALVRGERPPRVVLLEKEPELARHQTGHNSGVIHSGIYYRPGSLKARFTVAGARAMVEFAQQHHIPYDICGKVVVATCEEEIPRLEELHRRAIANEVPGARMISLEELHELEPHAAGIRAMHVASTGIIDYVAVARRYADIVRERGGEVRLGARVLGVQRRGDEHIIETTVGEVASRYVINCGGLHSDLIARIAGCRPPVRIVPFRGEYYKLIPEREHLVRSLIYPVPDPTFPFLGVHFTRMVRGGVEAGPNAVMSFKREGYSRVDFSLLDTLRTLTYPGFWRLSLKYWRTGLGEIHRSLSKRAFVHALQRLLPDLREEDLSTGGAGVRAQAIKPDGTLLDDFAIETMGDMVHVLNAPSPAATASLPIGEAIAERARKDFGI